MTWREELAWAAGFFDGEGTTGFYGTCLKMSAPQKDPRPLERFHRAVLDLGRTYPRKGYKGSTIYVWAVTDWRGVNACLGMLWQFLGEPKREQAVRALDKAKTVKGGQRPATIGAIPINQGGRAMWCIRGHSPDSMSLKASGDRFCLECQRESMTDACPSCGRTKWKSSRFCEECAPLLSRRGQCEKNHPAEEWVWLGNRHRCRQCRREDTRKRRAACLPGAKEDAVTRL
jgi:hypothetical protein